MTSRYTARPVSVPSGWTGGRAEIVFAGVEQAGPSFEGRVFLNNPQADESTPRTAESGYAGSFHVYGYGDPAPPGIESAPIEKRVHAAPAAVGAARDRGDELTITVVPVPADPGGAVPARPFEDVRVVFGERG